MLNTRCLPLLAVVVANGLASSAINPSVLTSVSLAQSTPEEAAERLRPADGLEVSLIASEPLVRQPVCIEFDDRGRLWVMQYLQYPNPAGLKRVQVDRYSRTTYDRVPEPPPAGPRGADRITILSDSNGDGRMDSGRDFVSGLNLATGLAFGHRGVFVLNVPYLLFYPDADRDDVPDRHPDVLLEGFGMEDAHSVANSLTWGPDGWLYGCQGSTVTASIRGIEFQQGVWRYHPLTKVFELFCEGGGNSWGLDFDRSGRLFYSTNYGGHVLLHGLQGGYFVKAFAKHGALHNPHAYGYFEHAAHAGFHGGHVTVGGIVYQEDGLPVSYRDRYIAGDLLGHGVYWHNIDPEGSTVRTSHGGELLVARDRWFAPTDVTTGPDGAVYVADWHDSRTAHPDPDADWDRSNGRIFRIASGTPLARPTFDYSRMSTDELLQRHTLRSQWHVRRARQELATRRPAEVIPALRETALQDQDEMTALEALWSLSVTGGFDESVALLLLQSPHASVRSWTVRLLGDQRQTSDEMAHRLDELAEQEPAVDVRQQLACTARRLSAAHAMPIINANINRDTDNDDPRLPLLWWWAVEQHSVSGRDEVMSRFLRPSLWKSRLGSAALLPRLIRRYLSEGTAEGVFSVVRLLQAAPGDTERDTLWPAVLQGWQESPRLSADLRQSAAVSDLSELAAAAWQRSPEDLTLLQLGTAMGHRPALDTALRTVMNPNEPIDQRAALLTMLAGQTHSSLWPVLRPAILNLLRTTSNAPAEQSSDPLLLAGVSGLGRLFDPEVTPDLLTLYRRSPSRDVKYCIRDVMFSREQTAQAWMNEVAAGHIVPAEIPLEQVRRIALLENDQLNAAVGKYWGRLTGATSEERLAEVRRLNNDLRAAAGDVQAGRELFRKHCASCHQLFGEGTALGPDLTTANRMDRDFLLVSLVDPSSVIRREYLSFVVETTEGQLLTGLAAARDDTGITLISDRNQRTVIPAGQIAEVRESGASLMPENLYRQLTPQQLRDLFAWLQSAAATK